MSIDCLSWVFVPLENFSHIWRRNHRWRATNFDLWSSVIDLMRSARVLCQTYCVTRNRFIMVISEDPWHSYLLPSITCFNDLCLSWPGIEPRSIFDKNKRFCTKQWWYMEKNWTVSCLSRKFSLKWLIHLSIYIFPVELKTSD